MAFSSTNNRAAFSGNGVTTVFSFPYEIVVKSDLLVILVNSTTRVSTPKILDTDFSVTGTSVNGAFPSGVTVTMNVAPTSGEKLVIIRDPSPIQTLTLTDNDPQPAKPLELSLDKAMLSHQRAKDLAVRSIKLPDGFYADFSTELPADIDLNSGKTLIVKEDGTGIGLGPSVQDILDIEDDVVAAAASAAAALASQSAAATSASSSAASAAASANSAVAAAAVIPSQTGNSGKYLKTNGTAASWSAIDPSLLTPTGSLMPFAGSSSPSGWLICDGSTVSRTTQSVLFAVVGSAFGSGDGSTTFNLPDMRGRDARGLISLANVTGTGSASSNNATFTAHGYNRTGVHVQLSSGTLSGLTTNTDYWTIFIDANTLAFATSKANAIAGTKITLSGSNTGVIKQYESPDESTRVADTVGGNSGATIGAFIDDALQGHFHSLVGSASVVSSSSTGPYVTNLTGTTTLAPVAKTIITDGVNGTPRTSAETRSKSLAFNWIIKT